MEVIIFILIAYLIGSIPFGLLITKAAGLGDVRNIGSGNIGATNVLRTGNKKLAALTLLLDGGKGALVAYLPIILIKTFMSAGDDPRMTEEVIQQLAAGMGLFVGLFAMLGHCYPIWLKFKGGKGVATALGVLLAAVPYVGLLACATWLVSALITRISSLSALITCALAPIYTYFLYNEYAAGVCFLLSLLIFAKHHENIKRLLKNEEPKIGSQK